MSWPLFHYCVSMNLWFRIIECRDVVSFLVISNKIFKLLLLCLNAAKWKMVICNEIEIHLFNFGNLKDFFMIKVRNWTMSLKVGFPFMFTFKNIIIHLQFSGRVTFSRIALPMLFRKLAYQTHFFSRISVFSIQTLSKFNQMFKTNTQMLL